MAQRVFDRKDLEMLAEVLKSGNLCSLDGEMTHEFEKEFAKMLGSTFGVAMNGAMSVLHAGVLASGAGTESEVICDPVFVFGPMAALYANAVPRFVDILPDSHNMDPDKLEAAINERTKAVIVTHAWGLPAQMDRIVEIAHGHGLTVIEDCAHAILATYKGKCTGTWGDIGSFSFQGSKQMSLGDGGMAITDDEKLTKELGLHAGAPTFHCVAHGLHYNYRMTELAAAVGLAQIERMPGFVADLTTIARIYDQAVEDCKWLPLQAAQDAVSTYHLWAANFRGEEVGIGLEDFKQALAEEQCDLWVGYTDMPAYRHPVIRERMAHSCHCPHNQPFPAYEGSCPIAEHAIPRMLLANTVKPVETARREADALNRAIGRLG